MKHVIMERENEIEKYMIKVITVQSFLLQFIIDVVIFVGLVWTSL